jgi:pyruvate carboxylase
MKRALAEFRLVGVATNIPYLEQILDLPDFIDGRIDTGFLDRHEVLAEEDEAEQQELAEIAALLLVTGGDGADGNGQSRAGYANGNGPARARSGWREQMSANAPPRGMGRWPRSI